MTESGYWNEAFDTNMILGSRPNKGDPPALWDDYLRTKQGPVGLRFPDDQVFHSNAFAQRVGEYQIVEFAHSPIDYQRSAQDVRSEDVDSYRLLICVKGSFKAEQKDAREVFRPGDVGLFRWHEQFFMTQDEPMTAVIMTVPVDLVDAVHASNAPLRLDNTIPVIRAVRTQALSLSENRDGWTKEDFEVVYTSVLRMLDQALAPSRPITPEGLVGVPLVRWLMQEHASDPTITLEAIAGFCGISERTLRHWLKQEGLSAYAMLRDIRLSRARQQLALPIDMNRISYEAGFTTARRFTEAFQRRYKITPAQLRKKLAAERAGRKM